MSIKTRNGITVLPAKTETTMQKCDRHNVELECMGGRSAHPSNWYCPECDKEDLAFEKETGLAGQNERVVMPPPLETAVQVYTDEPRCPNCGAHIDTLVEDIAEDVATHSSCSSCAKGYILGGHFEFAYDVWQA